MQVAAHKWLTEFAEGMGRSRFEPGNAMEFLTFYANINLQNIDEKIVVAVFYFRIWARLLKIKRKYKKIRNFPEHPNVDIDRV